MPAADRDLHRQRFCIGRGCGALFFICSHCDRGQRYCSTECQQAARLSQRRAANSRNQQTPEGRFNHRVNQQIYRLRLAKRGQKPDHLKENVTDQGSNPGRVLRPSQSQTADPLKRLPQPGWGSFSWLIGSFVATVAALAAKGFIFCRVCGRPGRFVDLSRWS